MTRYVIFYDNSQKEIDTLSTIYVTNKVKKNCSITRAKCKEKVYVFSKTLKANLKLPLHL